MTLATVPMTIRRAKAFVKLTHRHHDVPQGALFAVGVGAPAGVVGVAIIGRPVARMLQDGWTAEVTRLATDGARNACSMLYGAAWRAARALGYQRLVTYILDTEPGVSLRASGWTRARESDGGSWSRRKRKRTDKHPTGPKVR